MNMHHNWKTKSQNIFYFHHHTLAGLIILIGGLIACWILYMFLLTSSQVEHTPTETNQAAIKQEALGRITLWSEKREEEGRKSFAIPSSVFANPPVAP